MLIISKAFSVARLVWQITFDSVLKKPVDKYRTTVMINVRVTPSPTRTQFILILLNVYISGTVDIGSKWWIVVINSVDGVIIQ